MNWTAHNHPEPVEGCYRCDLSRDEVQRYTPTDNEVRAVYASHGVERSAEVQGAEFDRWLARVRREAKVEALREAADAAEGRCTGDWNGTTCDTCRATARRLRARADRIEAEAGEPT